MDTEAVVNILKELVRASDEERREYALASEKVKDLTLKSELRGRSELCGKAVSDLETCLRSLGGEPDRDGSAPGAVQRGWVAVQAAFSEDDRAVLEDIERSEDQARSVYEKALQAPLPSSARMLVEEQHQSLLLTQERIRNLRDSFKHVV